MTEIKNLPVPMWGAYLDESGILDADTVCAIAGFMGPSSAMLRMGKKWASVLKKFGVEGPFHCLEFYAPPEKTKQSRTNPYRGWSKSKRKKFENALLAVMLDKNVRLRCVAVDAVAFRCRTEEERRYLTGGRFKILNPNKWLSQGKPASPYHYALRVLIQLCAESLEGSNKRIHFFMSQQNQFQGFALELYSSMLNRTPPFGFRQNLDNSITFASCERYFQLQAADFVAYHLRKVGEKRRVAGPLQPRGIHRKLVAMMEDGGDLKFIGAGAIDQHCNRFKERREEAGKKTIEYKQRRGDATISDVG